MVGFFRTVYASLKGYVQRIHKQSSPGQGTKKPSPGHRYKQYDHSTDDEHRTAEQYNWRRQNVLAVLTTLFALGAVVFAYETFVQTRRQADIAQDALTASNRPWVMLADIKPASLSSDDEFGVDLRVNILVKNIGHSPAQNVSVSGKLLIVDFDPPPDQVMATVCQEPRNGSFVIPGQVVFPDQTQDIDGGIAHAFVMAAERLWNARAARVDSARKYNTSVGRPDRAQAWAEELSKFPFHATLSFVGCINYRSSDNKVLYQTSFMFDVSATPGGGGLPLLGGERPVTIPPSRTPEDPDIMVVHPRMMQRTIPGDQIRLEKPLYSTFAN